MMGFLNVKIFGFNISWLLRIFKLLFSSTRMYSGMTWTTQISEECSPLTQFDLETYQRWWRSFIKKGWSTSWFWCDIFDYKLSQKPLIQIWIFPYFCIWIQSEGWREQLLKVVAAFCPSAPARVVVSHFFPVDGSNIFRSWGWSVFLLVCAPGPGD